MTQIVQAGDCIRIHFSLSLTDGTVVDGTILDKENNRSNQPYEFCLGQGVMLNAFEDIIIGMQVGEHRQFQLPPQDTFGFADESNFHWIEREKFSAFSQQHELQPGLIIEFDTPAGDKVPGVVLQLEADQVLIDFNHPLAGKEVIFAVEVVEILVKQ